MIIIILFTNMKKILITESQFKRLVEGIVLNEEEDYGLEFRLQMPGYERVSSPHPAARLSGPSTHCYK